MLKQIHESLKLSISDSWSETALTHIQNTHTLTPPWLLRPLNLGEVGFCLMVWFILFVWGHFLSKWLWRAKGEVSVDLSRRIWIWDIMQLGNTNIKKYYTNTVCYEYLSTQQIKYKVRKNQYYIENKYYYQFHNF